MLTPNERFGSACFVLGTAVMAGLDILRPNHSWWLVAAMAGLGVYHTIRYALDR